MSFYRNNKNSISQITLLNKNNKLRN